MRLDIGGEALGGFIQRWGGRAGGVDHGTQFQITISHPAMSTIRKLLLEPQHPRNISLGERVPMLLERVGGYSDWSTCVCLHGSCVVCVS